VTKPNYNKLLFERSIKPNIILSEDGTIIQFNDAFREKFKVRKLDKIQDLCEKSARDLWNEYFRLAKKNNEIEFGINLLSNLQNVINTKVLLIYCEISTNYTAYFKLVPSYKNYSENIYINSFHNSGTLLILADRDGVIIDVNDSSLKYFDLTSEFFIGKKLSEFTRLFSSTTDKYEEHMKLVLSNGSTSVLKRYEKNDGEVRFYFVTTVFDEETGTFITRIIDQTIEVMLGEKLVHTNSLSSVGELAASIAHEIRNPLTTLKGFTQLLRISAEGETVRYLNVIDDEINRMESILSEMLVLSKPSKNERKLMPLQKLVSDMIKIITPKASMEGIEINFKDDNSLDGLIYGDEIKLKQVLLNIIKNAMESMSSSGLLTIRIKKENENQIISTIEDTGKGISGDHLKQIFNPYFTTRTDGNGFGLPFVYNTIKDHGGSVDVESDVGKGTKFTLTFPIAAKVVGNEIIDEKELSLFGYMA